MEDIDGQDLVFKVIAKHIHVIAFDSGDALLFLKLLHGRKQVAVTGCALVFLILGSLVHALAQ